MRRWLITRDGEPVAEVRASGRRRALLAYRKGAEPGALLQYSGARVPVLTVRGETLRAETPAEVAVREAVR